MAVENSELTVEIKNAPNAIGEREIHVGSGFNGKPVLILEGETEPELVIRELCIAELDESTLDSKEQGDAVKAATMQDVKGFMVGLEEAKDQHISVLGLARKKYNTLLDNAHKASVVDGTPKTEIDYQLSIANNAYEMIANKKSSISDQKMRAAQESEGPSPNPAVERMLLEEATQHNERVKRNKERSALLAEAR